jgi:hypothetical protein
MKNILLISFLFLTSFLNAQYVGIGVFTRIQSTTDLTNGYYVITAGTSNAMSNIFGGLFFSPRNFTEVGNTIINPPTSIVWKIETNGTFRTIKSENLSKFVSFAGEANNMQFVDEVTSDNQKWAITDNSSIFFITNALFTNQRLSYYPEFSRWTGYPGTQIHPRLYKLITTLSNETFSKNNFSIYPNPVQDFISIQNENNLPIDNIDVFDISSKKVLEDLKISETIKVEKLSAGVYFLKISSEEKTVDIKFIKL